MNIFDLFDVFKQKNDVIIGYFSFKDKFTSLFFDEISQEEFDEGSIYEIANSKYAGRLNAHVAGCVVGKHGGCMEGVNYNEHSVIEGRFPDDESAYLAAFQELMGCFGREDLEEAVCG